MSCHCTKILVHLLIIVAVSNLHVYKLIGLDPANLFKHNSRNTRKRCKKVRKYSSKLTTNTAERRCGEFIVNFEYISHLPLVLLLFTMNK